MVAATGAALTPPPCVQIFVRPSHISVDPYLRGWMESNLSEHDVPTSGMVGKVVQSKHDQFREGDAVFCYAHWATITQADPNDRKAQVFKLPDVKNIPPSAYLGCLVRSMGNRAIQLTDARSLARSDLSARSSAIELLAV